MDPVAAAVAAGTWKEQTDPKGKKYYYNPTTKETCWDLAKKFASDPVAAALASGVWKEKTDDKGKKYFYNKETKETVWDLEKKLGGGTGATTTAATAASAADPVAAALAAGTWKEKTDPKNGKTYYYNPTTKETCWDLAKQLGATPASAASTPASAASAASAEDPVAAALAAGTWKEKTDPKNGKTYYYNPTTKETCWDLAKKLGVVDSSAATTPRPDDGAVGPSSSSAAEVAAPAVEPTADLLETSGAAPAATSFNKPDKWVPPPPPAFPPAPPQARHPSKLTATFDLSPGARRSSHGDPNAGGDAPKSEGWRNLTKSQWLAALDLRMGGPPSGGMSPGRRDTAAGPSPERSSAAARREQHQMGLLTATGNISALDALNDMMRKPEGAAATSFLDFRDGQSQTVFAAPTADVAVATLHAASNIAELVPLPDAGQLACSTLVSLKREQERTLSLLQHIQGTLASQMQEAGVAFSGHGSTRQLKLNIKPRRTGGTKDEAVEAASLAKELGAAYQSLQAPPAGPYWRFVTEHDTNALYDDASMRRGRVTQELSERTAVRHQMFDRIHDDLREQYILREKMWTEYSRVGASSFVDVADFVIKAENELKTQRAKDESVAMANAVAAAGAARSEFEEFDD